MGEFSAGEAISSGFRLIAREPVAVLWWAAVYLVIGVLPQAAILAGLWPDVIAVYQQAARDAAAGIHSSPTDPSILALQSRMMVLQPVILLTSIVSQAIVVGAIYRGVLQPQERRFGYVRFSWQELWLGVASLVLMVVAFLLAMALSIVLIVGVIVAAMQAKHGGGDGITALAGTVAGLAGVGVIVWLLIRLSLALPMSFARGRFLFGESWELTRGHALKMFFVGLAVFAIVWLLEMLLLGAMFAVVAGGLLHGGDWRALLQEPPQELGRRLLPWLPLWVGLGSILGMGVYAIMAAPWAEIYRELSSGGEPA